VKGIRSVRKRLNAPAKPLELGIVIVVVLVLAGVLVGGLVTAYWSPEAVTRLNIEQKKLGAKIWPPRELHSPSGWSYVKVDKSGWSAGPVGSFRDLGHRLGRPSTPGQEIVIPIFPTVYTPKMVDKLYYDAILKSPIKPGDKVLVIGTGSGADAWVASLKSKAPVYVVEINPMAVINARATARLAGFQIKPLVGSIIEVDLPRDFRDFDYVLWNMPYVWKKDRIEALKLKLETVRFHDGDDGTILKRFLALLPSLLKKGGTAMVLNSHFAKPLINVRGVTTTSDELCTLFVIPNP
jgi:hypothetical protein